METGGGFNAAQRRALAAALRRGEPLHCPVCDVLLGTQAVDPKPELPYVRRRVWVLCPSCRRTASIDEERKSGGAEGRAGGGAV
jgi:hypothetical protein